LVRSIIYGISTHDPATFIAVPVVLLVVVAIACAVPARRAMRVSPLVALRSE
jgi:ABC-type lipoprotein release transport system permease subunit